MSPELVEIVIGGIVALISGLVGGSKHKAFGGQSWKTLRRVGVLPKINTVDKH